MVFILLFGLLCLATLIYHFIFNRRFEMSDKPRGLPTEEFPDLIRKNVTFRSGCDVLHGSFYKNSQKKTTVNALLIICHGMSNGSRDYLSYIHYFTSMGIEVLAYDNTGCHNSSGNSIRGLPQAIINLGDVLKQLSESPKLNAYHQKPLFLLGHSWGGYACACILNTSYHKRIKAVICLSAPNSSISIFLSQATNYVGKSIYLLKPFFHLVECSRFGSLSTLTAIKGINHTTIPVLACHSLDDVVVVYSKSIVAKQKKCTNPNATFMTYKERGHNIPIVNGTLNTEMMFEFYEFFLHSLKTPK